MSSITSRAQAGFFWTLSSTVFLKVITLGTTFIILTRLSVYEYGLVELVLSVVPSLSFFLLPGFVNMIVADMGVARGRGDWSEVKTLFLQYSLLQAALGILAWAIVFFGANLVSLWFGGIGPDLLRVVSFTFLLSPLRAMISVLISVYQRFAAQSALSIAEELAKLLAILIGFYVFKGGVYAVVIATIAAQIVAIVILIPLGLRLYKTFSHATFLARSPFALLLNHGKWNIAGSYLNALIHPVRIWVIKILLGTEAVGIFAVAHGLLGHATSLLPIQRVVALILPQHADDKPLLTRLIVAGTKYQIFGYVLISVGLLGVMPFFIGYFFPNYVASLPLFFIMLLFLVPNSFGTVTSLFFIFKEQKNLFYSITSKAVCAAILAPILILLFGLPGAALEYVLTGTWYLFERYRAARGRFPWFKLTLRDFFTFDEVDRMVLTALRARAFSVFRRI